MDEIAFFKDRQCLSPSIHTATFEPMNGDVTQGLMTRGKLNALVLHQRWPWHLAFWLGYVIFRFWLYYITVQFYAPVYLHYMLLSEVLFVGMVYYTLWLYRKVFDKERYRAYFIIGALTWLAYLYGRTEFQFYYLRNAPGFRTNSYTDIVLNNVAGVIVYFLFITSCKYFRAGYIQQRANAEKKSQQLIAEVANLKSQIAPHFLFNTLNNLYGLAVDKSDKLPHLMLRLSELLRHSLYKAEKPFVTLTEEMDVLKSYVELESIRLEDNLQLTFTNRVPDTSTHLIAPLILIVFVENAFKHARFLQSGAINIAIRAALEGDVFTLSVRNNYNNARAASATGIGLVNVKRRLEVLYPAHLLKITKDATNYTIDLGIPLIQNTAPS